MDFILNDLLYTVQTCTAMTSVLYLLIPNDMFEVFVSIFSYAHVTSCKKKRAELVQHTETVV